MKLFVNGNMKICLGLWLLLAGLICFIAVSPVHAGTITVTNGNDDGEGSLRKAIADAVSGDTIVFQEGITSITLTTEQLIIDKNLTIDGGGVTIQRSESASSFRIFYINGDVTVRIYNTEIRYGRAPYGVVPTFPSHCGPEEYFCDEFQDEFCKGGKGGNGGGIYVDGILTLKNSIVSHNRAGKGVQGCSVIYSESGAGGAGGGIYVNGTLNMENSIISNNVAGDGAMGDFPGTGGYGGGIYANGTLNMENSTVNNNIAGNGGYADPDGGGGGNGGGVCGSGTLRINNSTINNNVAGSGGGAFIWNGGIGGYGGGISATGTLTLKNSTISGNSAGKGGGSWGSWDSTYGQGGNGGWGGGIFFFNSGRLVLENCTITSNTTDEGGESTDVIGECNECEKAEGGSGGGVYVYANSGAATKIKNTIIAGNTVSEGGISPDWKGDCDSMGYNLIGDRTGSDFASQPTDLIGTSEILLDPLFNPLYDNGGATQTHALQSGSPAISSGSCTDIEGNPVTTDQRGMSRSGNSCDIGAYENSGINVMTNLAAATYVITGPASTDNGSGISWRKKDAVPGEYTISYDPVECCTTPASEVKAILENSSVTFSGTYIDNSPPEAPTDLQATPPPLTWSNNNTIAMTWTAASDCGSGVAGYSYIWDTSASTEPDNMLETYDTIISGQFLSDGNNHYLHVCTVDNEGNTSSASHIGPFFIDANPPVTSAAPGTGVYTSEQQLTLTCDDEAGSGCATIYYTTDGSEPTIASASYSSPISINEDTILKFFSVDDIGNKEQLRTEYYSFTDSSPPTTSANPEGNLYNFYPEVTLTCDDQSGFGCAATYYTTDGSEPTPASFSYSGSSINIHQNTTLKFFSVDNASNAEPIRTETYIIDRGKPSISVDPGRGLYNSHQQVTLTCNDGSGSGCAATYYTTDRSTPTTASDSYSGPISIAQDTTLKFFSTDNAGNTGNIQTHVYTIDTDPPVTSAGPAGGSYSAEQEVTLTCNDNAGSGCAAIHYTTDGSEPTTASPSYSQAPFLITQRTVLKFLSVDNAGNTESLKTEHYIIDKAPPVTSLDPAGDIYNAAQRVTFTCDDGTGSGCAETYYTADGSDPTTDSLLYSEPIFINNEGETILRFFSTDKIGHTEQIATQIYTIDTNPPSASADPGAGTYNSPQKVILACNEYDSGCATIHYTTDGNDPTTDSPSYSEPVLIENEGTTLLKFISLDRAGNTEVSTEEYIIDTEGPEIAITRPGTPTPAQLERIEGTASDALGEVSGVQLQITDGTWFLTGFGEPGQQTCYFIRNEAWIPVSGADAWSFEPQHVYWRFNTDYRITVKATDTLGNSSDVSARFILGLAPDRVPDPSSVTCNPSESNIIIGESFSISGHISPAPPGQNGAFVNISLIPPDTQEAINRPVHADRDGRFSYDVRCGDITREGTWRVRTEWAGGSYLEGSVSDDRTFEAGRAESRVTLNVGSRAVKLGDRTEISGRYRPLHDCGRELSGIPIVLHISGPDGKTETVPVQTDSRYDSYEERGIFSIGEYDGLSALGEWTIRAVFEGDDVSQPAESDPVRVRVVETAGYAVIIQGKIASGEGLASHSKTAASVYSQMRDRDFFDDDIMYLTRDTDGIPSEEAAEDAVTRWAADKMNGKPANLHIVMVDHGMEEKFLIHPDTITSAELGGWLDRLQERLTGQAKEQEIIVILGFCHSGSFTDELSGEHRVIIASAASDEFSFKGPLDEDGIREGEYFISEFFKAVSFGKSVRECFQEAAELTRSFTAFGGSEMSANAPYFDSSLQHPLLDDNGDGKGSADLSSSDEDGLLSGGIFVGVSTVTNNNPDDVCVTRTAPTIFLDGHEDVAKNLWACVDDDTRLRTIWVEMKAPGYNPVSPAGPGQAEMNLPKSPGIYGSVTERYDEWRDLPEFSEPGTYQVFYFAKDDITGNVSPLTETRVYRAKPGNRPPAPFSLISPEDGETVPSAFLKLDWTDAGDPDGDRLTYTVVLSENDASFGNPVLREGLSQSACLITPFDTVKDSEHYYWKVRAVDRYGAVRETGVREFHVRNTSPVLTWIGGHVYDVSTNRPVTGALVRIGSTVTGDFDPLITLNTDQSGYYLSDLPSHADTVRIEADGYRPASWLTGNTFDDILSGRADKSEDMVAKKDFGISLTGDMMTDGRVDLKDAVLALQVLTGLPVSLVSADAALDQQKVGLADVVYVLQKITGLK